MVAEGEGNDERIVMAGVVEMEVVAILEGREDGWVCEGRWRWRWGDGRVCRAMRKLEEEEIEIEDGSRRRSAEKMMRMVVVKVMEIANAVVRIFWRRSNERTPSTMQNRRNEREVRCVPLDPNRRLSLTRRSLKLEVRLFVSSSPEKEGELGRVGRKGEEGVRRE